MWMFPITNVYIISFHVFQLEASESDRIVSEVLGGLDLCLW